jgi:hypothetical protein
MGRKPASTHIPNQVCDRTLIAQNAADMTFR